MWRTNLKLVVFSVAVLGLYTAVANSIPQVESDVPAGFDLSGDFTPAALTAAGERIFSGAGSCTTCHGLATRAPNLLTDEGGLGAIGTRCGKRRPGMSCKEYLWEALTEPGAFVVPGYQAIMPDLRRTVPTDQVWAVVAFLQSAGGGVDVTAEDVRAALSAGPSPLGAPRSATASLDPRAIINAHGCVGCHVLDGLGGPVGPPFDGMGSRLTRDDIRRSILEPAATIARGYEQKAGMMPATFGQQLSAAQLEALVGFLASRR